MRLVTSGSRYTLRSRRKPQWRKWQTRAIANRLAYTDQVRAQNSCACSASRPGSSPGWGTITATGWSFQPTASLRTRQLKMFVVVMFGPSDIGHALRRVGMRIL